MNKSKRIKSIIFLTLILIATLISYNCERDDICAETTPTTPRLMVEFYDATETEELKPVTRLTVYGEGLANNPTNDNTEGTLIYNVNATALELPLLIGNEGEITTSRFILEKDTNLRLDENVNTNSNIDIIEISYETEFVYVSRACGYKSIFKNLQVSFETSDDGAWISGIEVVDTVEIVENENTVHVRILH
jgi:hypothetical protein